MAADATSDDKLITSRFRLPDRQIYFSRAVLSDERIELSGWHWGGRYERTIRLDDVKRIVWWKHEPACNLVLELRGGERFRMHVQSPGLWRLHLERLIPEAAPHGTPPHKEMASSD